MYREHGASGCAPSSRRPRARQRGQALRSEAVHSAGHRSAAQCASGARHEQPDDAPYRPGAAELQSAGRALIRPRAEHHDPEPATVTPVASDERSEKGGTAVPARVRHIASLMRATNGYGAKISLADDDVPPGRGPPEMTKIFPATAAAPRPWRDVGMRACVLQALPDGS